MRKTTDLLLEKAEAALLKIYKHKIIFFICLFVLTFGITITRRPDAVIEPQFWAEDGVVWYNDAYSATNPLKPLLLPVCGYFQTISRIGAMIAVSFDIGHAPLIFNLIAILITVLPVLFFLSSRFEKLIPKISHRLFLSLAYLCIPGASEVHANLTNAQWHLAMLMILVVVAPASKKILWQIFDGLALLISGLSGPFSLIAFPLFLIYSYFKRSRRKIISLAILGIAFLTQLYSFLFVLEPGAMRSQAPLGANVMDFFKILASNVFLKGLISPALTRGVRNYHLWEVGAYPVLIGLLGIFLLAYAFRKAKLEMRLFIAFAFILFILALLYPDVSLSNPQWPIMAGGPAGRYWFIPIIAWIATVSYLFITEANDMLRIIFGLMLVCLIFIGIPHDFKVKKPRDYHYQNQVAEFNSLKSGESFSFKIPPGWNMTLIKK